ncbi:hypothetical protein DEU56DRAFT_793671 [Suillus clintonianus]|uniref:uncharacterized protein n=1 Tax=Suillus clintonianus TaxID=1904413 RepID=UPI001B86553C|nr:uncharacterized protein DEU56DRAFT_793671 [Suillus clintonianus]KAG2142343.1 hypothetical protein DEU56DRAFT_793671 [Suillus clintonianus]
METWDARCIAASSCTWRQCTASLQQEPLLLRVDRLGSRVTFLGLVKDDAFARSRLIPGGGQPPETWVVTFQRL